MILIIICLAAILGMVALLLKLEHYHKAKIDLQRAEANLAMSKPGGDFHTSEKDGTLVAEIVQDLASQMPVAAALASAEKRDDATFASAAASSIISLLLVAGLAGTLSAFSGALGNRPTLDRKGGGIDADAVIKYTDQVHTGLTGAFWPSFAGIIFTVLLFAFRSLFVHPQRDRLFADLERFGHHLTHKLFPPYAGDSATMLQVVSKLESISTTLESNSTNLTTAALNAKTAAEKLDLAAIGIATANSGFEKTFGTDGVAAKGLAALRETFTQFAKAVRDERKQRKKSEDDWLDALAKIGAHASSQEAFAARLEKINADIIAVQAGQTVERDNTLKSIGAIIESLRSAAQEIESKWEIAQREIAKTIETGNAAQTRERETAQKGIVTSIENLKTTVQGVETRWEASHRDALMKFGETVATAIQKVADSANDVPETIAQAKLSLDGELLKVQRSLAEAHTDFLRRVEEAVKNAVEGTERASAEIAKLERGMSNSLERLTQNVNSLVGALSSLAPHLRMLQAGNHPALQNAAAQKRSILQKMFDWVRRSNRRE